MDSSLPGSGGSDGLRLRLAQAAALVLGFALVAKGCICMPRDATLTPIWVANGVALAALIRRDVRRWPETIAACAVGNWIAGFSTPHTSTFLALSYGVDNAAEYTLGAFLLRRLLGRSFSIERGRHLLLLAVAAGVSAALAAVLQSAALYVNFGFATLGAYETWVIGHALGLLLATPCFLALAGAREHLRDQPLTRPGMLAIAMMMAVAAAVFSQARYPVLFMISPALLFITLTLGTLGAVVGVIVTTVAAMAGLVLGRGPIMLIHGAALERAAILQLFLLTALFSSLPVAGLQARRRRAGAELAAEARRARLAEAAATQSEAHYRKLAETVSDAIGAMNMQGALTYVSPAVEAITGYPVVELIGVSLRDHIAAEDWPTVNANFRAIASTRKESGTPIEYRFRHKDGHWIWLQANPTIVRDADGAAIGVVDVVRDVTARKQVEAALEEARRAAEAAAVVKAEFLANMSHELRTPLTAIIGFGGLMAEDAELRPRTRSHLERVRTASEALLCTVNDVLDFSKLEAGQVEICRWSTDMAELGRDVLGLLSGQAQAKGLALVAGGLDRLPARLDLDRDRVRQVLVNLLSNAVKFTTEGEVRLTARYDGATLLVRVADTGPGIPQDRLGLLFQRFSQIDGSSTRQHGGAGLGLAICKGLVEAMGGRIGVSSVEDRGSAFWFEIPAAEARPADAELQSAETDASNLQGVRILVVDDNVINRELVAVVLEPLGCAVSMADSGEAGLEACATTAFDLILIDRHMPGLDGEAVAACIRRGGAPNAGAVLIAFSADVLAENGAAFDGVISKPVTPAALTAAMRGHLRGRGDLQRGDTLAVA